MIVSHRDLDEVLKQVIGILNDRMHVETGSVLLRELGTDQISFAKILRGRTEQFANVRLKVGQGIVGRVVETGKSIIVNDVRRDKRWFSGVDKTSGFVTRAILCVPLTVKGEVIGAIELLNKRGGDFTELDLDTLESISGPIAIAIQNARLHQIVLDQLESLERLFRQVEHAKHEWETTVDAMDQGIILTDTQGGILRANTTFAKWMDATPGALTGKPCFHLIDGADAPMPGCPHARSISAGGVSTRGEILNSKLGAVIDMACFPLKDSEQNWVGSVTVLKDVTKERELQAQLLRSEKIAELGRMAVALAHGINNPLQGMKGALYLASKDLGDPNKQLEHITVANDEVSRLTELVHRMLGFYHPARVER